MTCEAKKIAFEQSLATAQQALNAELAAIASQTERRAEDIEREFQAANDTAAGVGAAAGTAIGGVMTGPGGAAVGAVVGRTIGSLFTLEIQTYRYELVLDVPQTRMSTRSFSFDVPSVAVRDSDIIFDLPTVRMERVPGPPIPHTRTRMRTRCVGGGRGPLGVPIPRVCTDVPETTVEWEQTWVEVPVPSTVRQRIVLGIPEVTMQRQEVKLDVPEITMAPTSFSVDVPSITLRFIQDAGRRTAAQAAALAQSAQEVAAQKQAAFAQRLKHEVAPLALEMFACFRQTILDGRAQVQAQYDAQISTLSATLTKLIAEQVPANNPQLVDVRQKYDTAVAARQEALARFDQSLLDLDAAVNAAMDQFMGGDTPDAMKLVDELEWTNALITFVEPKSQ